MHRDMDAILLTNQGVASAQVYLETAQQAGFDGPYLIELTIMLLLSKVYPSLSATPAYRRYFHDLRGSDLARARQLTEDPYMLIKFKVDLLQPATSTSLALVAQIWNRLTSVWP